MLDHILGLWGLNFTDNRKALAARQRAGLNAADNITSMVLIPLIMRQVPLRHGVTLFIFRMDLCATDNHDARLVCGITSNDSLKDSPHCFFCFWCFSHMDMENAEAL